MRMRSLFLALLFPMGLLAQQSLNLGFEQASFTGSVRPHGWDGMVWRGGEIASRVERDTVVKRSGSASLRVQRSAEGRATMVGYQVHIRELPFVNAPIRLGGWIRTEGLQNGRADLISIRFSDTWWRFDSLTNAPERTDGWQPFILEVPAIPPGQWNDSIMVFGVRASGTGTVWFDDMWLEVNGRRIESLNRLSDTVTSEELAWLRRSLAPLDGVEIGRPTTDLRPVLSFMRSATVIGLGEGTHGTSEFLRFKHRLLEAVVAEGEPVVFMLEDDLVASLQVNHYVQTGRGRLRDVMSPLYGTSQSGELADIIEWMREHNAKTRGPKVEFVGFDITSPLAHMDSVISLLEDVDADYLSTAKAAYAGLRGVWERREHLRQTDSAPNMWRRDLMGVATYMQQRVREYSMKAPAARVERGIHFAGLVAAGGEYLRPRNVRGGRFRDSVMAVNLLREVAQRPKGTRFLVSAHNGHVARRPNMVGEFVSRALGDRYRVIAMTTHEGTYAANVPQPTTVRQRWPQYLMNPGPRYSFEGILHELGVPRAFLDIRNVADPAGRRFLSAPREFRYIGSLPVEWGFELTPLTTHYDGIVFLDRTRSFAQCPPRAVGCAP